MKLKAKVYKGCTVAPGTELFNALEDKDAKKAEQLHAALMATFHKHVPKDFDYRSSNDTRQS